eukprot:1156505-Pelagomonas_calceolata.AAC.14
MHKENCKPNVVTYNSLIAACAHGEGAFTCAACCCLGKCAKMRATPCVLIVTYNSRIAACVHTEGPVTCAACCCLGKCTKSNFMC